MVIQVFRTHRRAGVAALVAAALVAVAPAAQAQGTTDGQTTADVGRPGTPLPGQVVTTPSEARRDPYWEINGGYEGDSRDTGYAFFGPVWNKPLRDNLTLQARVYLHHLRYEFPNADGGETEVEAPGVGPAVGLKWGRRNWVKASTGLNFRREERKLEDALGRTIREDEDTEVGLSLGGEAWWNPTSRSNVHAMLSYGTLSDYVWGRVAAKRQLTNADWSGRHTLYLGAETIGQGNEDIRSWSVGPILELAFARTSLSLQARGGYRRTMFDHGDDDDGAYFGVGLWKRF